MFQLQRTRRDTQCRADSTHLSVESTNSSAVAIEYGEFDVSVIPHRSSSGSIQLNSTFTISSAADDDTSGLITDKTFDANKEINLTASFDVSRRTNDDPWEVIERSITDPDLPDEILPEAAVTYSIVENGSQRNQRLFCDGTFKITPEPFVQTWSIHAFINRGDSYKQVPLVFCLMSRRKTSDYVAIFERLVEVIDGDLAVQAFVADFEKGAWKAIRRIFTTSTIKGCAFHFNQALFRKVQNLGLKTSYSQRGCEYRYIRQLMALPFLPSTDILPAFDQLAGRATSPQLVELVNYIENTWMSNPVWLPRNWSIFQHTIRTNNDIEGWHTRINKDLGRAHPSFYIVVPALRREADLVTLTYRLVSEEQMLRDQRARRKEAEGKLHYMWQEYLDGHITASNLLSNCAKHYGPVRD